MEDIHIHEILAQVGTLVGTENAQGEAQDRPQVNGLPRVAGLVAQVMDLGMAVVARRDAVGRLGGQDLVGLELAVGPPFVRESGLQEATTAAAAEVVGSVGIHVDEVFLANRGLDHETQVLGHGVAEGLAYQLAGILDGELDLTILVPFGAGFQPPFADPLGVVLNDAFDFEIGFELEFFQSGPDCKEFVPSLRIEPDLAAQVLHGLFLHLDNVFPAFVVTQEHAVVLSCPAWCRRSSRAARCRIFTEGPSRPVR